MRGVAIAPVILPISGRRSRSIIAGTHSMGGVFGAEMSSGAPGGDVVDVKRTPGIVILVAAWMFDPACAGISSARRASH
jgi:hypothetical protein